MPGDQVMMGLQDDKLRGSSSETNVDKLQHSEQRSETVCYVLKGPV